MKAFGFLRTAIVAMSLLVASAVNAQTGVTIHAGAVGGLYMESFSIWAEIWRGGIPGSDFVPVLGGGVTNPLNVALGEPNAVIGGTDTVNAIDSLVGRGDFAERSVPGLADLRALFRFNTLSLTAVLARADVVPSGVNTLGEFLATEPSVRWAIMPRGNSGEVLASRLLGEYDLDYEDLRRWGGQYSFNAQGEIGSLMIDRHADVAIIITRAPASWVLDIDASLPGLRWLKVEEEVIDSIIEGYGGYLKAVHPSEFYSSLAEPFVTLANDHVVFVQGAMDEELAFQLTRLAIENADTIARSVPALEHFDPEVVCHDTVYPLHPGAERACRTLGVLD